MPLIIKAFAPEIILSLAILYQIVFYHSGMIGNIRENYPVISKEMYVHVILVLLLVLSVLLMNKHEYNVYGALLVSYGSLKTMKVLVVITAICICPAMFKAFELEKFCHPEYFTLFLIVIFSLLLMISANDLLVFYLIMEMQTISFYILVSFKRDSVFSSEAGLKYFISGSFISGIYLFGCMLLYLTLGTGNLDCITSILTCKESFRFLVLIGVILITVTLLFKLSCAPFHAWMVDVYDGAPSSTTVILATLPKIAFTFFLMKWLSCIGLYFNYIQMPLLLFGILSILIGIFSAITQIRLKRILNYSSVAQVGFILCGISTGTAAGFSSAIVYLVAYTITSVLLWSHFVLISSCLTSIIKGNRVQSFKPVLISTLSKLWESNSILSITIIMTLFSISGIPPFLGFMSKVFVLIQMNTVYSYPFSIFVAFLSAISAFYYIRLIKIIYFEIQKFKNKNQKLNPVSLDFESFFIFVVIFCLLFFLFASFFHPEFLSQFCDEIIIKTKFFSH